MNRFWTAALALLLVALAGCAPPRSRVHGKVVYQNKPLTEGTVIFFPPDNQTYPVAIQPDGSYQAPALPRGLIRVAVQVEEPRPAPRPDPDPKRRDAFAKQAASSDDAAKLARNPNPRPIYGTRIPARFGDPNHSGLSFQLTAPDQEFVIELK
jgi:hypothetical protein